MITVIADDLTGAAEIAGICLQYGIKTAFGIDALPQIDDAQVLVIATDTRSLSSEQALEINQQLTHKLLKTFINPIVFKKCDSVLRGHVLIELQAIANVLNKTNILLQPANPYSNRCIKKGYYFVDTVEIDKTGFSQDPDFPAKTASVKQLLTKGNVTETEIITGNMSKITFEGIHIPDCNSVSDLKQAANLYQADYLIGGSAAFFEQFLLKLLKVEKQNTSKLSNYSKNYALISGSTHPKSIAFAKQLKSEHIDVFQFPDGMLTPQNSLDTFHFWLQDALASYQENKKIVFRISNNVVAFSDSSKVLKNRLSKVVKSFLKHTNCTELFIEGGATAYDILKTLKVNSLTPLKAYSPGVVRMQCDNIKLNITIKPGSYEWPKGVLN